MWVDLKLANHREQELSGFTHCDLMDLKHVVERAIAAAEREMPGEVA